MLYQKVILFLLTMVFLQHLNAQCPADPLPQAVNGYGADGIYTQSSVVFNNPVKSNQNVYVYYPSTGAPAPTVFFSHAYAARDEDRYRETIKHLNSLGYTVVYPQYPTILSSQAERYDILWEGFKKAATDYPQYIDTTQVAFFGHSFGGGATPRMTLNGLSEGWGVEAMYIMAPWYSYDLMDIDLNSFPVDIKMVMMMMEDDDVNDHRIGIDIYKNISITAANKAFYILSADTESGCTLVADHAMPLESGSEGVFNGSDFWNWYHMDALLDYAFTGSVLGQDVSLGNGSYNQQYWGTWWTGQDYNYLATPATNPQPSNAESFFQFPCSDTAENPRATHCNDYMAGPTTLLDEGFESGTFNGWTVTGNPLVSTGADSSGTYGARVRKLSSIQKQVSTAGYNTVALEYMRRTKNMDNGEYLTVEWSVNGSNWTAVEQTQSTSWGLTSVTLPAGAGNSTGFRVRFITNGSVNNERADIDGIVIVGQ